MRRNSGTYYLAALSLLWGVTVSGLSDEATPARAAAKPLTAEGASGDFTQGLTVEKGGIIRSDAAFREITYQIDRLESRLRRKPGQLEDESGAIRELRGRLNLAREAMERLSAVPTENRAEAQAQFNARMRGLLGALHKTRDEHMSQKEAFRWDIELRLKQMKDKIDAVRSRAEKISRTPERDNLDRAIASAEETRDYVREKMKRIDESDDELWLDLKTDLGSMLNDLENSYLDARSQVEGLEKSTGQPS